MPCLVQPCQNSSQLPEYRLASSLYTDSLALAEQFCEVASVDCVDSTRLDAVRTAVFEDRIIRVFSEQQSLHQGDQEEGRKT